ncbi:Peroxisomal 2,4-dienoyl-CoA reductase [Capsicum annuum]|uniref:2,4-dienoyl-CoA reductase [(3E)-enoyl-CoA-producing] n=2 Tax=Capsicum annuum TaxID=4072 RepID=A0A2G2YSX7_CAPAN|nr:Peroxisomal 2,4-dienoyl-CoA reductase [Capsicum annuum]
MKGVMHIEKKLKLSLHYVGPYLILKKVDYMTYELDFPSSLGFLHLVFHVSMLKKFYGRTKIFEEATWEAKEDMKSKYLLFFPILDTNAYVLDIDSVSTFTMLLEALNYIKKGGPGKISTSSGLILNISDTLHYTTSWYQIYVAVPKAVIDLVTRYLALEWGIDYDIKVNSIAQSSIGDTASMHKLGLKEISNKSREYMPLYKLREKYDIAMAALYLASDAGWWPDAF